MLELNKQRAEQEGLTGAAAEGKGKNAKKTTKKEATDFDGPDLFGESWQAVPVA